MYQSVEAIVEPSGVVRLLENVLLTRPTRAVVTILAAAPRPAAVSESLTIVDWLDNNPLPVAVARSHQDIEESINELRQAWD